ncbi:MAG: S9 family peptidase [Gemmatimonadaceae bacterium]
MHLLRLATLAGVSVPTLLGAQQRAPRPFVPADWYRLTTVSAPAMSSDGRLVAFTVTTVKESENKRHAEVWVVATDGGAPQRFTSPSTESSNPRFSPDGKYLLFTSTRPGSKARTWGLRMDQPAGEAVEMDAYPAGSLPRDKRFVVWSEADTAPNDTTKKDRWTAMQAMARPPFGAVTEPLDPKRFDGRHITEMSYKANGPGFLPGPREARAYRAVNLWTKPLDGPAPKRKIDEQPYSRRAAAVSPDGRWVAYVADRVLRSDSVVTAERDSLGRLPYNRVRDEAPRNDVDIYVISVAGGEPRRVATFGGNESDLEWSPDGTQLAFVAAPSRTASRRLWVVRVPAPGQPPATPVNLLGNWQYEPDRIWWLPNGTIAVSAAIGGRSALLLLDPGSKSLKEVVTGSRRLSGFTFDEGGTKVAYVATSHTKPTELYVANLDGTGERRLTAFNDSLNAQVAWSDAERFTYKSLGNREIEAWLMKPHGYAAGKKYPLVLYIHGGPHSAYGENWFDEFQNIAATGMFVLFTNPRGSSGYGADFTFATRARWFDEDYVDLMKAVDIVAQRSDVDSTRMGVTGGSYGGVMTAWVTVKTNRFKAAQADRMISNWWSWYGTSDAQGLTEFEFLGKPWDNPALYDTLSPIRYIRKVKTPTLIVQSEEDHRTPMTDAEQWFMALKKHGIPVELVRYPRSTHDLSRTGEPWLLVDRLGRLRQWFNYWLKPEEQKRVTDSR